MSESSVEKRQNVKLGVIQCCFNQDSDALKKDISEKVAQAAQLGSHLVLLQELFLMRYPGDLTKEDNPECFDLAENLTEALKGDASLSPTFEFCRKLATENQVFIVGSLFEKFVHDCGKINYYNTAIVVKPDGGLLGKTRKQHIPSGPGTFFIPTFFTLHQHHNSLQ